MAAWQLGFAMQSGEERLRYALNALQDPEEAVRRGAIRVLEREWPGSGKVKTALVKIIRDDRHARVKQAALDVLQRGWPNDELILGAIRVSLEKELAYTYAEKIVDYLAISWAGMPRALELLLQLAGARLKPLQYESRPNINDHIVRAIVQGWRDYEGALPLISQKAVPSSIPNARIVSVRALATGWAADPATLPLLQDRLSHDEDAQVRIEVVRALATGWAADPAALGLICHCIEGDSNALVRCAAIACAFGDIMLIGPYVMLFKLYKHNIPITEHTYLLQTLELFPHYLRHFIRSLQLHIPIFPEIEDSFQFLYLKRTHGYVSTQGVRLQSFDHNWRSAVLSVVLERAVADSDSLVRATAITYTTFFIPEETRLDSVLKARGEGEPNTSLRSYIHDLAAFRNPDWADFGETSA